MWDYIENKKELPKANSEFSPFKCDMYSLRVCMQMMISETEIKRESHYIYVLNKVMKELHEEKKKKLEKREWTPNKFPTF